MKYEILFLHLNAAFGKNIKYHPPFFFCDFSHPNTLYNFFPSFFFHVSFHISFFGWEKLIIGHFIEILGIIITVIYSFFPITINLFICELFGFIWLLLCCSLGNNDGVYDNNKLFLMNSSF